MMEFGIHTLKLVNVVRRLMRRPPTPTGLLLLLFDRKINHFFKEQHVSRQSAIGIRSCSNTFDNILRFIAYVTRRALQQ